MAAAGTSLARFPTAPCAATPGLPRRLGPPLLSAASWLLGRWIALRAGARDGGVFGVMILKRCPFLQNLQERLARNPKGKGLDARPYAAAARRRKLREARQRSADQRHAACLSTNRRQLFIKRREPVPPYKDAGAAKKAKPKANRKANPTRTSRHVRRVDGSSDAAVEQDVAVVPELGPFQEPSDRAGAGDAAGVGRVRRCGAAAEHRRRRLGDGQRRPFDAPDEREARRATSGSRAARAAGRFFGERVQVPSEVKARIVALELAHGPAQIRLSRGAMGAFPHAGESGSFPFTRVACWKTSLRDCGFGPFIVTL